MSASRQSERQGQHLSPEQAAAAELVALARELGLELTGPGGLPKMFTKNVLETALNEEMTEHFGHEKNRVEPGRGSTNVRNGTRANIVLSDAVGEVEIAVPRDHGSTFEPQIVKSGSGD
jgi:transposase-like protein